MTNNKFFYLVFILICFILTSCSIDQNESIEQEVEINYEKIDQIIQMPEHLQRLAYSSLSANERLYIWSGRLSKIKSFNLNQGQKELLERLENHLSVSFFDNTAEYTLNNIDLQTLKSEVVESFGYEVSRFYFSSLQDLNSLSISQKNSPIAGPNPCNCNVADDWCPWGSGCFVGFCTQANSGCGWWLQEACIGKCVSN
jgi:hypothetical protein